MSYTPREIAHNSPEDIEDRRKTVARLEKLGALIEQETDREKRAWLLREDYFYRNQGRHCDWPAYYSHLREIERKSAAEYAKKEKERLAKEAAAKAADDALRAKIQAKIDEENDPVRKYRLQNSERTF